jgi:hypothetical protein
MSNRTFDPGQIPPKASNPLEPIEQVATLDMVGLSLCRMSAEAMADENYQIPHHVLGAVVTLLRVVRDEIASAHDIGSNEQIANPEFLAALAMRDLYTDGLIDEGRKGA